MEQMADVQQAFRNLFFKQEPHTCVAPVRGGGLCPKQSRTDAIMDCWLPSCPAETAMLDATRTLFVGL